MSLQKKLRMAQWLTWKGKKQKAVTKNSKMIVLMKRIVSSAGC